MLSRTDVDDALELAERILLPQEAPDYRRDLLEPVGCLLNADTAAFREVDLSGETPRIIRNAALGVPSRLHNQYLNEFYKFDPAISSPAMTSGQIPAGACLTQLRRFDVCNRPPDALSSDQRHRYWKDFLRPNRLLINIGFHIQAFERQKLFLIDFHRRSSAVPFSDREFMAAQMVFPSIQLLFTNLADEGADKRWRLSGPARLPFNHGASTVAAGTVNDMALLTEREAEVAIAVMKGLSNKEIARLLGVSVRTAENHLRNIFKKYDVHSRSQLWSKMLGFTE